MALPRKVIDKAKSALPRYVSDVRKMGLPYLKHIIATEPIRVRKIGDVRVRRGSDSRVFSQVFSAQQYELERCRAWPSIWASYEEIIERGKKPLIIDLGANNGASALWFSHRYPSARVVAVEPDPGNAETCRHNVRQRDICVVEAAIGAESGAVSLVTAGRRDWAITTERSADGQVPVITVQEILDREADTELFLVKIDIEGFEADLFAANLEWMALPKVIMMEPHDWIIPGTSRSFQAAFGSHDFDLILVNENLVYLRRN